MIRSMIRGDDSQNDDPVACQVEQRVSHAASRSGRLEQPEFSNCQTLKPFNHAASLDEFRQRVLTVSLNGAS